MTEMTMDALVANLRDKIDFMRGTLEFKKLVREEDVAPYMPGGELNQGPAPMSWIVAYARMIALCQRMPEEDMPSAEREKAEQAVLDAMANVPVPVELEGSADGPRVTVHVFPQSFLALERFDLHDRVIGWLTEQRTKLLEQSMSVTGDALLVVGAEIIRQYALIAWAATHPDPGLPPGFTDAEAQPPEWLSSVTPIDLIRIHAAFVEVNLIRLHSLYSLLNVSGGSGDERRNWRTWFATRSEDSNVPVDVLMRDRTVGSLVATAMIAADVRQKAIEQSKKESR